MGTCTGAESLEGDSDMYQTIQCSMHSSYTFNLTAVWSALAPSQAAANPPRALEDVSFMVQFALYIVGFSFTLLAAATTVAISVLGMRIYVMDMVFKTVRDGLPWAVRGQGFPVLTLVAELIYFHLCVSRLADGNSRGLEAKKCVLHGRRDLLSRIHLGCIPGLDMDGHTLLASRARTCGLRPLSHSSS